MACDSGTVIPGIYVVKAGFAKSYFIFSGGHDISDGKHSLPFATQSLGVYGSADVYLFDCGQSFLVGGSLLVGGFGP